MSTHNCIVVAGAQQPQPLTLSQRLTGFIRRRMAYAAERRRRARRAWLRHTTEIELSRLPPEVQKDIGWPHRQDY